MTNGGKKPSPLPLAGGLARVAMRSTASETLLNKALKRFHDTGTLVNLSPGETLFEQGTDPEKLYLVLRGVLTVVQDGVPIAEVSETELIGEMAYFLRQPRSATVRASTEAELYSLSPEMLLTLLQNTELGVKILGLYAHRLEAVNKVLTVRTQRVLSLEMELEELGQQHENELEKAVRGLPDLIVERDGFEEQVHQLDVELQLANAYIDTLLAQLHPERPTRPDPPEVRVFSRPVAEDVFEEVGTDELYQVPPADEQQEGELEQLLAEIVATTPDDSESR